MLKTPILALPQLSVMCQFRISAVRSVSVLDVNISLTLNTDSVNRLSVGTSGPFPWGKARLGRDADRSPHLVPRWTCKSCISATRPRRRAPGTVLFYCKCLRVAVHCVVFEQVSGYGWVGMFYPYPRASPHTLQFSIRTRRSTRFSR
jgi:hypothetical protein